MPRSCCVKNCSNNAKSQPNMNFYILPSNKQQRERWLQATGRAQQRLRFCTPRYLVGQLNAKELYFCSFVKSTHQIFTQMYLIKVYLKKFSFGSSPHFYVFEPPNKYPPNRYMPFQRPTTLPIPRRKSRRHMNSVVNN